MKPMKNQPIETENRNKLSNLKIKQKYILVKF